MTTLRSKENPTRAADRIAAVLEQTKTDPRIFVTARLGTVRVNDDGSFTPLPGASFTEQTIVASKAKKVYIRPAREGDSSFVKARGWRLARHVLRVGYVHPDSELPSTKEEDAEEDAKIRADFIALHGEEAFRIAELVEGRRPEGGFEHVADLALAIVLATGTVKGGVLGADVPKPAGPVAASGKPPIFAAADAVAEAIAARMNAPTGQETADIAAEVGDALIRFGHAVAAEAERAMLKRIRTPEE